MDYSLHFALTTPHSSVIATSRVEETKQSSESIVPMPLPPAPQPLSLNGFRGMPLGIDGDRIALREGSSTKGRLVIKLRLPGVKPPDPDHGFFYNAIANYVMRRCDAVLHRDDKSRMQIEARDGPSGKEIADASRAIDEVRTLVHFMQSIGGDLGHICALLRNAEQTQTIIDLHCVFGGDPEQPTIQPTAVLRLSNGFAAAGRPDLQLGLLDRALPQCPTGKTKSKLAQQWIALATRAMNETDAPPLLLQQVIVGGLINDRGLELDQEADSELMALAGKSILHEADSEALHKRGLIGSPTSWKETDALSTLTPDKQEERSGIDRSTTLMLACQEGLLQRVEEEVERCMEKGTGIDDRDAHGFTALTLAAIYGHPEIVQYLLKLGANRDAKDNRGKTPMDWAVENHHVKVAEILGKAGATITLSEHSSWAARRDRMTTSRASDAALSSPLPANAETIGVRRKNLARSSVDDLVQACKRGDLATVQQCIAEEVDCDARGKFGQRPLHYACRDGENPEIVALLLKHGADCERKDEGGNTPLMVACHKGKASLVKVLLESGANANTTNHLGMTPLMVAAQLGREDIVELLFAQEAKLEAKCDQGRTALTYSVASRDIKVATFLLYKGAVVESRDDLGLTPLMHAARSGELRPVELLLSWRANREAKDNRGLTAADHAKAKDYSKIAEILATDEKSHKKGLRKLFS